jgi:hypothetical protein
MAQMALFEMPSCEEMVLNWVALALNDINASPRIAAHVEAFIYLVLSVTPAKIIIIL